MERKEAARTLLYAVYTWLGPEYDGSVMDGLRLATYKSFPPLCILCASWECFAPEMTSAMVTHLQEQKPLPHLPSSLVNMVVQFCVPAPWSQMRFQEQQQLMAPLDLHYARRILTMPWHRAQESDSAAKQAYAEHSRWILETAILPRTLGRIPTVAGPSSFAPHERIVVNEREVVNCAFREEMHILLKRLPGFATAEVGVELVFNSFKRDDSRDPMMLSNERHIVLLLFCNLVGGVWRVTNIGFRVDPKRCPFDY